MEKPEINLESAWNRVLDNLEEKIGKEVLNLEYEEAEDNLLRYIDLKDGLNKYIDGDI